MEIACTAHAGDARGVRALRSREGRVHRRQEPEEGPLRSGRRRHDLPRRDRRHDRRLQAKLLRVLEEQTFRRVGGTKDITVDIRVIAATNRNLRKPWTEASSARTSTTASRSSRSPCRRFGTGVRTSRSWPGISRAISPGVQEAAPHLAPEAERLLVLYEWPGNVRELRNVIERAMILEDTGDLLPGHLPPELGQLTASAVLPAPTFSFPRPASFSRRWSGSSSARPWT